MQANDQTTGERQIEIQITKAFAKHFSKNQQKLDFYQFSIQESPQLETQHNFPPHAHQNFWLNTILYTGSTISLFQVQVHDKNNPADSRQ